MPDQYAQVVKAPLKLKTVASSDLPIKKKKKKEKREDKERSRSVDSPAVELPQRSGISAPSQPQRTKAEQRFYEMQQKKQTERIMTKAEKTHKQRVAEFNKHLDSLSEHYDIPKVSWTK